jgi:TPR repeat protein
MSEIENDEWITTVGIPLALLTTLRTIPSSKEQLRIAQKLESVQVSSSFNNDVSTFNVSSCVVDLIFEAVTSIINGDFNDQNVKSFNNLQDNNLTEAASKWFEFGAGDSKKSGSHSTCVVKFLNLNRLVRLRAEISKILKTLSNESVGVEGLNGIVRKIRVWLYMQAANAGELDAQIELALCHQFGLGVPADHSKAFQWMYRAAESGSAFAQGRIGLMFFNGTAGECDVHKARKWWVRGAQNGDAESMFCLGYVNRFPNRNLGLGTVVLASADTMLPNFYDACRWWLRAAEVGHLRAMFHLGKLLFEGIPKDQSFAGGILQPDKILGALWLQRCCDHEVFTDEDDDQDDIQQIQEEILREKASLELDKWFKEDPSLRVQMDSFRKNFIGERNVQLLSLVTGQSLKLDQSPIFERQCLKMIFDMSGSTFDSRLILPRPTL